MVFILMTPPPLPIGHRLPGGHLALGPTATVVTVEDMHPEPQHEDADDEGDPFPKDIDQGDDDIVLPTTAGDEEDLEGGGGRREGGGGIEEERGEGGGG